MMTWLNAMARGGMFLGTIAAYWYGARAVLWGWRRMMGKIKERG